MTRRDCFAIAGMAFAGACGRRKSKGFPGSALIATAGDHFVSVVDLDSFRLIKQVSVGAPPQAVLANGVLRTNYVLTPKSGTIHALNSEFQWLRSVKLADELYGFKLSPDGLFLCALARHGRRSSDAGELIHLDARHLAVKQRSRISGVPRYLDISPDGSVAVSTGSRGTVEFFDAQHNHRSTANLGGEVGEIRFRPDGKLLLAANFREQALTALAVPRLEVVVHLPLAMQPQNLCFNADGGQLFITGKGMDGLAIAFPYLPLEIEQTVLAGRDPGAMACSGSPAYLFVASASGSDVCILNVDSRKMIGIVEVGEKPGFIAVTPDNQYALVLNENSGDLAVIRIAAIQANIGNAAKMRSKSGASLFTMLPVGTRPVHAAIVPRVG